MFKGLSFMSGQPQIPRSEKTAASTPHPFPHYYSSVPLSYTFKQHFTLLYLFNFMGVFVPLHTSRLFSFLNNIFPYIYLTFWTFHYWEIFGGLGCFGFLISCSGPFITSFYSSSPFFYLASFDYFSHVLPTSSYISLIFCFHTQPR